MSIIQITVQELAERLASNHAENHGALQLIDVRERDEVEIAAINGFTVLPLSEYDQWASDFKEKFDPNVETLVLCHHGMRSAQMCQWLINQGFTNVKNISGGIDAYAYSVDLNMAKYWTVVLRATVQYLALCWKEWCSKENGKPDRWNNAGDDRDNDEFAIACTIELIR